MAHFWIFLSSPRGGLSEEDQKKVERWPTVFSGITVISNRITHPHRDQGGAPYDYDMLVSAGTTSKALLTICDNGMRLQYKPGTVVAFCGRLLQHEVKDWPDQEERICVVHFIRSNVIQRLIEPKRGWVNISHFTSHLLSSASSQPRVFSKNMKRRRSKVEDVEYTVAENRYGDTTFTEHAVSSRASSGTPSRSTSPVKRSRNSSPLKPPFVPNSGNDEMLHPETEHPVIQVELGGRSKPGQTQNDSLRDWLPYRRSFLFDLLDRERPPPDTCNRCKGSNPIYRCKRCVGLPSLCLSCCQEVHLRDPFHPILKWSEEEHYYARSTPKTYQTLIYLGHNGERCPQYRPPKSTIDTGDIPTESILSQAQCCTSYDVVVVDIMGVKVCRVVWCACDGSLSPVSQLLQAGFFPATVSKPETVFSFQVLDHYYLDVQECHTSAYSFYQKLRRISNGADPKSVPDRYRELMRASRQWNNLKLWKRFGFGYGMDPDQPGDSDLAMFCAACPQPGINLDDNWMDDKESFTYRRHLVLDGNFVADHMKMRQPGLDVPLADGMAFTAKTGPYDHYLENTEEPKRKTTCSNHKALSTANANRQNLECTGVGVCACARHGCFTPGSLVDFRKGEQQRNMDYSLCKALNYNTEGIQEVAVYYDVCCQFSKYFESRVEGSDLLEMPEFQKIYYGVGKFHLGAHIDGCFFKFSPNFIEGTGQVDGEIVETLWAEFNKISSTARSMSRYHRLEVLDHHMNDSNFMKNLYMREQLMRKYSAAHQGIEDASASLEELALRISEEDQALWEAEEECALREGGEALENVYGARMKEAPSQAEIRLQLGEEAEDDGDDSGATGWITLGLSIQQAQNKLRQQATRNRKSPSVIEKNKIQESRLLLLGRVNRFHSRADDIYDSVDQEDAVTCNPIFLFKLVQEQMRQDSTLGDGQLGDESTGNDADVDENEDSDIEDDDIVQRPIRAEDLVLRLPSSVNIKIPEERQTTGFKKLVKLERKLREGQANDCLSKLRLELGHKSLLYVKKVRGARNHSNRTRAWRDIKDTDAKVQLHATNYRMARMAILKLGGGTRLLATYKVLRRCDLTVNKDVAEANRVYQRNDTVPWLWRLGDRELQGDDGNNWMKELYRVNYLRAKARLARWKEERLILLTEMKCINKWFSRKGKQWEIRAEEARKNGMLGHECYAWRQADMWKSHLTAQMDMTSALVQKLG